jgi:hypothetical protein
MIGSLLKQLFPALGRFLKFHAGRLLHLPEKRPLVAPDPVQPPAAGEPVTVSTATDSEIARLSNELGLGSRYEQTVQWTCLRTDATPADVISNELYKLWTTIPNGLKWTHYFSVYETVFGPIRAAPLRILEIGIWQGASMQLWRSYFENPDTIIVGIDILPECSRFDSSATGIHVRIGSQDDPVFLKKVVDEFGPFDLIIDDGSHHSSHIISSFNHLYADGLKESGIYFVEDLHANYWLPWRDSKRSFLDICKELMEHMQAHYRTSSPVDFLIDKPSIRLTSELEVPRIATMIKEIRVFDSIVAIYKTHREYVPYFLSINTPSP